MQRGTSAAEREDMWCNNEWDEFPQQVTGLPTPNAQTMEAPTLANKKVHSSLVDKYRS